MLLGDCTRMHARISEAQCGRNRKRGCLSCEGCFGLVNLDEVAAETLAGVEGGEMSGKTHPMVVKLLNEYIPAKVSRNEFCRATGINRNSVDRYRVGLGCPSEATLLKLAEYFGISVPRLKGKTEGQMEEDKGGAAVLEEAGDAGHGSGREELVGEPGVKPSALERLLPLAPSEPDGLVVPFSREEIVALIESEVTAADIRQLAMMLLNGELQRIRVAA